MPETSRHVQLKIDDEFVDIHKPGHDADQLRAYLESDQGFAAFKADPKRVLADRHLSISDGLAQKLKEALAPVQNVSELNFAGDGNSPPFTAYAWAQGTYSMANTKIIAQAISSIIGGH